MTSIIAGTRPNKGLIKENALPALDLRYFDPFVKKPLLAEIPYFHFNFKNLPIENGIALGTRAELEPLLGADFLANAAPRAGSYQFVLKGKNLAIVGGDNAGTLKGARVLSFLVESSETAR